MNTEKEKPEIDNDMPIHQEQESDKKKKTASIWIISGLAHGVILAFLVFWVVKQAHQEKETIIENGIIPIEELIVEKTPPEILKPNPTNILAEIDPILPPQLVPVEEEETNETDNNSDAMEAQANEDSISDSPHVGQAYFGNLGLGNDGGGLYGKRGPGGRKNALRKGNGSKETESRVEAALFWLAKHQEADGHWDSAKYEGNGTPEVDCADTGAALLAFLAAGHTDKTGKWKANVKSGVAWLVSAQRPNGSWDARNYANGICTMAIAEAAGMGCGGSDVKKSAEIAVEYLLKQQNASGCFDYVGPSNRDDMSVTGWCIMALKSASISGIKKAEIKEAFHKCGDFLDKSNGTKDGSSTSQGLAWYTPDTVGTGAAGGACQAIAMLVRQYLGWDRTAPWLLAAADGQITKVPTGYAGMDVYRVYYSFLTLFQQGGKHWKAWNGPVSKILVDSQRQDGDFKGSWDINGSHCDKGGRVLYTAFLCLSLEIYYRYQTIAN